jgi:hypothetical protein
VSLETLILNFEDNNFSIIGIENFCSSFGKLKSIKNLHLNCGFNDLRDEGSEILLDTIS